jgi:4-azaleucine resistance transporter AzlC
MTALFTVIFLDRWKVETDHTASILGVVISVLCLLAFGPSGFVIPAMLSITAVFLLLRGRLEKREGEQ